MCHYAPFLLSYKKITQQHLSEQAHAIFQATAQTFVQTVKSLYQVTTLAKSFFLLEIMHLLME